MHAQTIPPVWGKCNVTAAYTCPAAKASFFPRFHLLPHCINMRDRLSTSLTVSSRHLAEMVASAKQPSRLSQAISQVNRRYRVDTCSYAPLQVQVQLLLLYYLHHPSMFRYGCLPLVCFKFCFLDRCQPARQQYAQYLENESAKGDPLDY